MAGGRCSSLGSGETREEDMRDGVDRARIELHVPPARVQRMQQGLGWDARAGSRAHFGCPRQEGQEAGRSRGGERLVGRGGVPTVGVAHH